MNPRYYTHLTVEYSDGSKGELSDYYIEISEETWSLVAKLAQKDNLLSEFWACAKEGHLSTKPSFQDYLFKYKRSTILPPFKKIKPGMFSNVEDMLAFIINNDSPIQKDKNIIETNHFIIRYGTGSIGYNDSEAIKIKLKDLKFEDEVMIYQMLVYGTTNREVEKLVSRIARNSYYNLDPKIIQNTYTLLKKTNQKKLNEFFKYQPDVEASKRFKDLIVGTRTSGGVFPPPTSSRFSNHQFADSIGGHSSNYNLNSLK